MGQTLNQRLVEMARANMAKAAGPGARNAVAAPPPVVPPPAAAVDPTSPAQTQLDWDKLRKDREEMKAGDAEFYKIQQGDNHFRFLMNPTNGFSFYGYRERVYIPSVTDEKPLWANTAKVDNPDAYCPLTLMAKKLDAIAKGSSDAQYAKLAKAMASRLWPKKCWMSNVMVKALNWDVRIVEFGKMVASDIFDSITMLRDASGVGDDPMSPVGNIAHPDTGTIVVISKTGEGKFGTKYKAIVTPQVHPVTAEVLAKRTDLDNFCAPTPVSEVQAALCSLFGVPDFGVLIAPDTLPGIPALDKDGKLLEYATPQAAAAPSPQVQPGAQPAGPWGGQAPQAETLLEEELSPAQAAAMAIPGCVGLHGMKPEAGRDCTTCEFAVQCQSVTQVFTQPV